MSRILFIHVQNTQNKFYEDEKDEKFSKKEKNVPVAPKRLELGAYTGRSFDISNWVLSESELSKKLVGILSLNSFYILPQLCKCGSI